MKNKLFTKKLRLSKDKCSRIHIGKQSASCPELKVHEHAMKNSEREKYLGDFVDKSGKIKPTIDDRVAKGWGIVSEIKAILNELPLGKYKLEIGLQLRQAMLVNGVLYNSEAWHSVNSQDILALEKVDEALLRFLLGSHAKVPLEFLYLESGAIPIRFVISSRRINFLHTIIRRDDEELTKRVLTAQLNNPCDGDFTEMVKKDFTTIGLSFDLSFVASSSKDAFCKLVKNKIREAALEYLKNLQKKHTKVKDVKYANLEIQPYLRSPLFSNPETKLLVALRSRTADFKANFSNLNGGQVECPLHCWGQDEQPLEDTQQHLLLCSKLIIESNDIACGKVAYEDIFGSVIRQKEAITLFTQLLEIKEGLVKHKTPNPPGEKLDPSISHNLCCRSANFTSNPTCNNRTFIGN